MLLAGADHFRCVLSSTSLAFSAGGSIQSSPRWGELEGGEIAASDSLLMLLAGDDYLLDFGPSHLGYHQLQTLIP